MALNTSLMAEESFHCSICLELFNQPASIPCGHTFCLQCITVYWYTSSALLLCPPKQFYPRPMLCFLIIGNKLHIEPK
uniref:RING-type domain-containing protein n=1 Tax=Oryzias sinensis TaxID=183150 RepID=A0A8C8A0Y1_9TELE